MKTKEELIKIHKELHESLDKLLACWILCGNGNRLPSQASLMEILTWSHKQTIEPECFDKQENA